MENGKFTNEEMDKLLTMTAEFSRYMQEGILVIKLFFNEYLYYNTGEYLLQLLDLLQWMTNASTAGWLRQAFQLHNYEKYNSLICRVARKYFGTCTKYILRIQLNYEM